MGSVYMPNLVRIVVVLVVLVTGGKQRQLLVLGLRLEFDNFGTVETNLEI